MKQTLVLSLICVLVAGVVLGGCAAMRTTQGPQGATPHEAIVGTVDTAPVKWTYDVTPNPSFVGTPEIRLTSFGFDEGAAIMRSEGMGACREAVKKLADKPDAKLLAAGFADGIKEAAKADEIGLERAEAAKRFLGTLGIKPEQVQVTSFGSHFSTAKDFEKIKQGLDRKVEIWLLQP
jgi:outer membrane protein OmpA-like peptidoglycan-associated protein